MSYARLFWQAALQERKANPPASLTIQTAEIQGLRALLVDATEDKTIIHKAKKYVGSKTR